MKKDSKSAADLRAVAKNAVVTNNIDTLNAISDALRTIAAAAAQMRRSRLTERALLLLLQDASAPVRGKRLTVQQIKAVLDSLEDLSVIFVRR